MIIFVTRRSRLHNRFGIDDSEAIKEARELMQIRNLHAKEKAKIV